MSADLLSNFELLFNSGWGKKTKTKQQKNSSDYFLTFKGKASVCCLVIQNSADSGFVHGRKTEFSFFEV